ncbi:DUF3488 and transglutaminase-like domain-containing protein [Bifidobacterium saguinibicoloris]|uniref:DUF3488 and transglutaminase-like domain-containing protein n=1 Tax=Bifidobacterium saguinibicoloris TaxID=2834433 RepID=UPI003B8348F6
MTFPTMPFDRSSTSMPDMSAPTGTPIPDGTGTNTATATGSWADSTHSVIWMTRGGFATPLNVGREPWGRHIGNLAVTAALTLLAVSNLIDVYGDWARWAAIAIPATIVGCLVALAGIRPAMRLWWQIVFLTLAQFVVGPVVALNDTTIGHVLPSLSTLAQGWQSTFGSFKYLISIEPPTGTADGSLMAAWTLGLWTAFLTGLFAVMRDAVWAMVGAIPVFAANVAAALLGTDSGWWRPISGMASAILLVVWLSARWRLLELGRWLSSLVILVLAGAIAVGACLAVPQHRVVLRDHYEPPLNPYDYTSPLSGLRSYVKDHKDDTVLTARDLPAGTPVRLAVMDRFDGNVWNLSDSRSAADSSNYRRVGTTIAEDEQGERFTATFTVDEGLADTWLPLSGAATSVTFTSKTDASSFYYNTDTDSAIYPKGTVKGLTYTERGVIPNTPTDKQIDAADAASVDQPEAEDVPDSVSKLASAIAGGQSKGGEAARALAQKLKETGWFSHGLEGDYPSLPGHGNYRVDKLLAGTEMVGDSEQYASAMALMARELGLPSRVVMGFIPKNKDGEITQSRTEKQGTHTVTKFTGNDIEAWVEIKLDGYGWVAFYPTPKETKVPDENQDLSPPNPQTLVRQPPVPLSDPLRDEQQANGNSTLAGEDADDTGTNLFWARFARIAARVAIWGSPLWILLLAAASILLTKAVLLARARGRGPARTRVVAGWGALAALAKQSGVDAHGTRRDQARAMADQLHLDAASFRTLSNDADYAAFSGQDITSGQAAAYWRDVDAMRKAMLASLPRLRRWRTRLSLRGLFGELRRKPAKRHILNTGKGSAASRTSKHQGGGRTHAANAGRQRP